MCRNAIPMIISVVFLAGCGPSIPPKFGPEENSTRKEIGLPLIQADWLMYRSRKDHADRKTLNSDQSPHHSSKRVFYESGQWVFEQDYYYSGKKGPSPDPDGGTQSEKVTVSYAFVPRPGYPKGWTCHYQSPTEWGKEITFEEAERILTSWGIKRLNY